MTIAELNVAPQARVIRVFLECCGSREWATRMLSQRPFADAQALLDAADRNWLALSEVDWLEAFAAHPRIGEQTDSAVSRREQGPALRAADAMQQALAHGNAAYYEKFGFIFIVFATGKTADEMLAMLRSRLNNDRAAEVRTAAAEQMKITRLRLQRLLQT